MITTVLDSLGTFFAALARISLEAAILSLIILLAQYVFRKQLTLRWRYLLWSLVLIRLVVPTLPESPVSLQQFLPVPKAPAPMPVVAQPPLQSIKPTLSPIPSPSSNPVPLPEFSSPVSVKTKPVPLSSILGVIWLLGSLGIGGSLLLAHFKFLRSLRPSPSGQAAVDLLNGCRSELKIRCAINVMETSMVVTPAVFGLIRPTLLLPENFGRSFSPEEQRMVFLHELAHVKRGDLWLNSIFTVLQVLHWFNPLLWFAFSRMRLDRECATDSLVLSHDCEGLKKIYAHTLLKLAEVVSTAPAQPRLLGVLENKNHLKERFLAIRRATANAYGISALGVLLLLGIGAVTLTKASRSHDALRASLPPGADKEQVRAYVREVLDHTSRFSMSALTDPQITDLKKVGPDNIDVLIEEDQRINWPISLTANINFNYYASMAVCALARPQDRDVVLKGLAKNRYLVYTVVKMNWAPYCREELLRVFREEPGHFAPGWIEAIASLHDPSTYAELKNYLVTGQHREHTYLALKKIPDIGDLRETVEKAWAIARNAGGYEARDMAKIAAEYGVPDAAPYVRSHPESPAPKAVTTGSPLPMEVSEAAMEGTRLTAEEAVALAAKIESEPNNLLLRMKLIGYYFLKRSTDIAARDAVQPHILWVIKNHPDFSTLAMPFLQIVKQVDPTHYTEALDLWRQAIAANPSDANVMGNAAAFMQLDDAREAAELFKKAQSLEPKNSFWPERLAHLLSLQFQTKENPAFPNAPKEALAAYESAMAGQEGEKRFYLLTSVSEAAYKAGDNKKAREYAFKLLELLPSFRNDWNYGNAFYTANSVLGLIALQEGKTAAAESYLLASADSQGSPQLSSFGPGFFLAQKLLEDGKRKTVLAFLTKISSFWEGHEEEIRTWQEAIRKGETPKLSRLSF